MRQNCRKAKIRLRKRLLTVLLINWGGYSNLYYAFVLTKLSCFLRIFSVSHVYSNRVSDFFEHEALEANSHYTNFWGFFLLFHLLPRVLHSQCRETNRRSFAVLTLTKIQTKLRLLSDCYGMIWFDSEWTGNHAKCSSYSNKPDWQHEGRILCLLVWSFYYRKTKL